MEQKVFAARGVIREGFLVEGTPGLSAMESWVGKEGKGEGVPGRERVYEKHRSKRRKSAFVGLHGDLGTCGCGG